ncbi:MAG: hypothetical protein FJ088_03940 [Deltaproteobacteria bacterium]|nr:hypothetical protein [Deltaproteobacteria bacterium]
MNVKRYFTAAFAVFVAIQITNFIQHGLILMDEYEALKAIWNPNMMSVMWLMHLIDIPFSLLLVYIFVRGYENKGILEGIRFGLIIGLFIWISAAFSQWIVYPIPLCLAVKWFIFGVIQQVICGAVIAIVYKPLSS